MDFSKILRADEPTPISSPPMESGTMKGLPSRTAPMELSKIPRADKPAPMSSPPVEPRPIKGLPLRTGPMELSKIPRADEPAPISSPPVEPRPMKGLPSRTAPMGLSKIPRADDPTPMSSPPVEPRPMKGLPQASRTAPMELSKIPRADEPAPSSPPPVWPRTVKEEPRTAESGADDDDSSSDELDTLLPPGWTKFVHLNGGVYYSYGDSHQLLTTDDICVPSTLEKVLEAYTSATPCFQYASRRIHKLEMSVTHIDGIKHTNFASWHFCESYDYIDSKLVLKPRSAFWEHAGQFPMHRKRHVRLMETEFLSALAFGSNERILENKATTFPFEDAQIERLIRVFQDLRGPPDTLPSGVLPALSYHIARTMLAVAAARERYAYGTRNARMYRDIAIPPPTPQMWVWDFFLGVMLCGTHKNYRVRLEATVPKGVVGLPEFRGLMRGLMSEWADSNLVATVLVSVNVGFLAVPDITSLQRSFAVVSSLCAMTSIVTGLHHVWQHREKTDIEREDARQYLYFLHHCLHRRQNKDTPAAAPDLTLTASLLALPLATLQWSVLSFTLAIAAYAVQNTSAGEGRILFAVLLSVLGVLALGVFLFFWRIWAGPVHVEMEMEEIEGDGKGGGGARMRNVNLAMEGAGVGWVGTVVGRLWVRVGRLRGKRAERDREGGA